MDVEPDVKDDTATTPVPTTNGDAPADAAPSTPVEIVDVEDPDTKPAITTPALDGAPSTPAAQPHAQPHATFPGGFAIDVCFEASKLPLDVAIFNSARAAGGDEKIRKYLQAVLVIGGSALIPGMAHALESRSVPHLFLQYAC